MNNNLEWSKHIPHMTMKPRNVPLFRVSPIIPLTHLWYFKQKVVLSHWTIKGSTYPKWKKIKWVLFFFFFFQMNAVQLDDAAEPSILLWLALWTWKPFIKLCSGHETSFRNVPHNPPTICSHHHDSVLAHWTVESSLPFVRQ